MPVGYLDFNENCRECAVREVYEETGVKILNPVEFKLHSINSDPDDDSTQDVGFRYVVELKGKISDYPLSLEHMEANEVVKAKWINVKEIDNYEWAWNHKQLINKFINKYYKL